MLLIDNYKAKSFEDNWDTKEEAEENISSAEIAIQQKFDEKLREEDAKQINKSLPKGIRLEAIKNSNAKEPPKNIEKDLKDAGFSNAAIEALMNYDDQEELLEEWL